MVGSANRLRLLPRYISLLAVAAVMLFPLLWMARVALLPTGQSISTMASWLAGVTLGNFADLLTGGMLLRPLFNSVLVGGIVTLGNVAFCFVTAYALARYKNLGNKMLFGTIILVLMIPAHIIIIPLYIICLETGIFDSYWALILPWLVNPIGIFLVKQYIESLPTSMEEAARIDGASELRVLVQVVMPMCRPALAVLAIQVFFTNWNSFLFPFILTSSQDLRTLPVALAMYQGHQAVDWQHLMAGSTLAVIPVLAVFLFFQRQIVSGITAGAIKQ